MKEKKKYKQNQMHKPCLLFCRKQMGGSFIARHICQSVCHSTQWLLQRDTLRQKSSFIQLDVCVNCKGNIGVVNCKGNINVVNCKGNISVVIVKVISVS